VSGVHRLIRVMRKGYDPRRDHACGHRAIRSSDVTSYASCRDAHETKDASLSVLPVERATVLAFDHPDLEKILLRLQIAVQREFFPIRPAKFPDAPTVFLFVKLRVFLQSSEKARQVQRG
jgi:hypothetical protein